MRRPPAVLVVDDDLASLHQIALQLWMFTALALVTRAAALESTV